MKTNYEKEIYDIISKTFNIPLDDVKPESGPSSISLWDSLGQLSLVSALEEHFSIVFEFEELFQIVSVQTAVDIIESKINVN